MYRLWRSKIAGGIHVCGCGHSGTSILTRIIGEHPCIHPIAGESGAAKKERYSHYRTATDQFWEETHQAGRTIWVEKTPKHVRNLGFILNAAPNSKIILIAREPCNTIASLKVRYGSFGKSLRRWIYDNQRVLRWSKHRQTYLLRYEDLVGNPSAVLSEVMAFVGFDYTDSQLNYHHQPVHWYSKPSSQKPEDCESSGTADETEKHSEFSEESDTLKGMPKATGSDPLNPEAPDPKAHNSYRNHQINQPLFNRADKYLEILTAREIEITRRRTRRLAKQLGYSLEGTESSTAQAPF